MKAPRTRTQVGVAGAIIAIASIFHVPAALGISADEFGVLVGSLMTIGAALAQWLERNREK